MSMRRKIDQHRQSLAEIKEIMYSMKILAYMETRKLNRFIDAQQTVVTSMENVAGDFLSFYPQTIPELINTIPIYVLIGTERGFCGGFNHALVERLDLIRQSSDSETSSPIIAVGRKLHGIVDAQESEIIQLKGASMAEEIYLVLNQLVDKINDLQSLHNALEVFCLYHTSQNSVVTQRLLPPFQGQTGNQQVFPYPPILNLPPQSLLSELTDQYLLAEILSILYTSLMIENTHRVAHLDGAVNYLEEQSEELKRRSNALRQEEIIEEIEVFLLNDTDVV